MSLFFFAVLGAILGLVFDISALQWLFIGLGAVCAWIAWLALLTLLAARSAQLRAQAEYVRYLREYGAID